MSRILKADLFFFSHVFVEDGFMGHTAEGESSRAILERIGTLLETRRKEFFHSGKEEEFRSLRVDPHNVGALTLQEFCRHCEALMTAPVEVFLKEILQRMDFEGSASKLSRSDHADLREALTVVQRLRNGHEGSMM